MPSGPVDDVAAVVVRLRLRDREELATAAAVGGAVGLHGVRVDARVAALVRVVDVERGAVGGEGEPEQPVLAARRDRVARGRSPGLGSSAPLRMARTRPACSVTNSVSSPARTAIAVGAWTVGHLREREPGPVRIGCGGGRRATRRSTWSCSTRVTTARRARAVGAARGRDERGDRERGDEQVSDASGHGTEPGPAARSPTIPTVNVDVEDPRTGAQRR